MRWRPKPDPPAAFISQSSRQQKLQRYRNKYTISAHKFTKNNCCFSIRLTSTQCLGCSKRCSRTWTWTRRATTWSSACPGASTPKLKRRSSTFCSTNLAWAPSTWRTSRCWHSIRTMPPAASSLTLASGWTLCPSTKVHTIINNKFILIFRTVKIKKYDNY